jgi:hypothetical protein
MPSVQGATQGSSSTYSVQAQQGNPPRYDSQPRHEGPHPGGFRQPGNFTSPSANHPIAQTNSFSEYAPPPASATNSEYATVSTTSHGITTNVYFLPGGLVIGFLL